MSETAKGMREAQRWRALAEWFAADVNRAYVCNALNPWGRHPDTAMRARAGEHTAMSSGLFDTDTLDLNEYYVSPAEEYRSSTCRVIFCLLMALECESEVTP